MNRLLIAFFCLIAYSAGACADQAVLKIGKLEVRAELAATRAARERGLMERKHLCANCGMLFAFPVADRYGFWMKDTPLSLAIAFVARDGSILNIEEMQPYTLDAHYAAGDALYALEMNAGWFAAHGVRRGDKVSIPAVHAR